MLRANSAEPESVIFPSPNERFLRWYGFDAERDKEGPSHEPFFVSVLVVAIIVVAYIYLYDPNLLHTLRHVVFVR